MYEPNPIPNISAIENSPPADAEVRRIKAQLAPRMVTVRKMKMMSDFMSAMRDGTMALRALTTRCHMTHGDVSMANLLYYPAEEEGEHSVIGVLNDFDCMVFAGRHIDFKSDPSKKAPGDADVQMSHEAVVASLD